MIEWIREECGYSLVEVMVAIMILAVAIIPMVGMFDTGLRAAVLGGNHDTARSYVNEKLEEAKSLSFNDVLARYPEDSTTACNPGPPPGSPVTSCNVETDYVITGPSAVTSTDSSEDYATAMLEVTVTVQWNGGTYQSKGLISR